LKIKIHIVYGCGFITVGRISSIAIPGTAEQEKCEWQNNEKVHMKRWKNIVIVYNLILQHI
jgi:hypothetical protein